MHNPIIAFTKIFPGQDVDALIDSAHRCGLEGFDLCLRKGFPINPENAGERLPDAQRRFQAAGLCLPMIEGEGSLLYPDDPTAAPILAAMDAADIRLLKLGYRKPPAPDGDYWAEVDDAKRQLAGWEGLSKRYGVKICVHTHMGTLACNASSLMHLLREFDPEYIGAYIDPCHMRIEGEPFSRGAAMARTHLCAVGMKDVTLHRTPKNDHGSAVHDMGVIAGDGMVDWEDVFGALAAFAFDGPLSAHYTVLNYGKVPPEQHIDYITRETAFFKRKRDAYLKVTA